MQNLTPQGQQIVADIAARFGVSQDAVLTLLSAVNAGYGTQAQFNHPELGGMGQWSQGGMIMVGDMFNNALKANVDGMCNELSNALATTQMYPPAPIRPPVSSQMQSQGSGASFTMSGGMQGGSGWPQELGQPSSTGSQNNLRYAVFPETRRLAIDVNGQITVYDIGDHNISGFGQQQSGDQSISFTSQYGLISVASLPVVPLGGQTPPPQPQMPEPAPMPAQNTGGNSDEIFALIEKLAALRDNGVLSEAEFEAKKTELLGRL